MRLGFRVCPYLHQFLVVSLLVSAEALPSLLQEVYLFNVASEDAAVAIQQFAAQAGVQILADADRLKGKRLNAVAGRFSLEEGLRRLLAGSGLTYRHVGKRAIALVSEGKTPADERERPPLK